MVGLKTVEPDQQYIVL